MSNLEHLKKQAKQVLKWHRERHWPVAEQIRTALPGFAGMSDREVLDHEFKLADAQLLVASKAGFESWAELKNNPDRAEHTAEGTVPLLTQVTPHLCVADIDRSCTWYNDTLGFATALRYGEPPFYAQVVRDELRIALRSVDGYIMDAQKTRRAEEELLSVMFAVVNVKALYNEHLENGAKFYQALRTEPWGAKSFWVEDPDGNLLCFHEDVNQGHEAAS